MSLSRMNPSVKNACPFSVKPFSGTQTLGLVAVSLAVGTAVVATAGAVLDETRTGQKLRKYARERPLGTQLVCLTGFGAGIAAGSTILERGKTGCDFIFGTTLLGLGAIGSICTLVSMAVK